jgi:hypothetical protein
MLGIDLEGFRRIVWLIIEITQSEQLLERDMNSLLQLLVRLAKAGHQAHRTLALGSVEGSQGSRCHFGDEATKCVIEDTGAQALDACKLLIEAGRKLTDTPWRRPMARLLLDVDGLTVEMDDHPHQVGDSVLESEDGVALNHIAGILPSLLPLGQAGFALPIGEQLLLPQRHAAGDGAANHHADEDQRGLPHRSTPLISC